MNNFIFHNPTKILFGKGQIENLVKVIPANAKILMTYGFGSIKKNGVYQQVIDALKNYKVVEFGGIEPNPKYETLMKAVSVAKENNTDFILAVGGGSVIDGSKFIAAAALFEAGDPWNILAKGAKIKSAIDLGTVLTLPATGTEMNPNAVISSSELKEKLVFVSPHVYPKFSVLDPTVIASLPGKQISNGIVDTFVHVFEQYLTYPVNAEVQDRFAESIIKILIETAPVLLTNPAQYEAASNFMWASTWALNGAISAGVPQDWSTHTLGHELTALQGIDHARTLAIILPGVMNIMSVHKKEKILQYGERIWAINQGTEKERINHAIEKTVNFFESLDIPTRFSSYNLGEETIMEIIQRLNNRNVLPIGEHANMDSETIEKILKDRL